MMNTILSPLKDFAYVMLRIASGLAFSFHGVQKLFGLYSKYPSPPFGSQMWIGGVIELVCGLAITIGLFTSLAAFLASGTMAVAYIQFHWKFAFNSRIFPGVNEGELALIYCFLFLLIACTGGGACSLDRKMSVDRARETS